jgi:hypothetical protein
LFGGFLKAAEGENMGYVQARDFFTGMIHWILLYKLEIKTLNLPKQRLSPVTEDANKNLWGVSSQGIFRYDPHKDELYIYGDKFGTFDCKRYAYEPSFSTSAGELLFGNPDGYYKCLPNKVYNAASPQIELQTLKLMAIQ